VPTQIWFSKVSCSQDVHFSKVICNHGMAWLRLVGSLKLQVSFAKEPYQRDDILQKRPEILWSLLIVATPYGVEEIPSERGNQCRFLNVWG